jgi:hypothetical protein
MDEHGSIGAYWSMFGYAILGQNRDNYHTLVPQKNNQKKTIPARFQENHPAEQ